MNTTLFAKSAAFALAALVTFGMLSGVDTLAYEQHSAVQMARAASAPAATAAAKPAIAQQG